MSKIQIGKKLIENIVALKEIRNTYIAEIVKLAIEALGRKDAYTMGHSSRVKHYSMIFGKALGLSSEELYLLELSAMLHDIGKIGIPDTILKKAGKLTKEEYETIKLHPVKGEHIVSTIPSLKIVAPYVRAHHERYDGKGYPDGLKGEDIPFISRIILITDTYDAIISTRPYHKGEHPKVAFQELEKNSGTQFDPDLVKTFIKEFSKIY